MCWIENIIDRLRRLESRRLRRPQWTYKGCVWCFVFCLFRWKEISEILYFRISLSSYSPVYCGALFSLNARRPSSLSFVGMTCQPKKWLLFLMPCQWRNKGQKFGIKGLDKDQMSQPRSQGLSSCRKTKDPGNEVANERSSFALTKGERSNFLLCNLTVEQ